MATEQQVYEMLARVDHPVFPRDLNPVTTSTSPFNSIMNRVLAKQFVRLNAAIASLQLNEFPQTCDANTIDRWEYTFGLSNATLPLADRIIALLNKINQHITMSAPTVISIAQSITGQTPYVVRNVYWTGWIIGSSIIGINTVIGGGTSGSHSSVYIVIFTSPITSAQRKLLDSTLTTIEKGGSSHAIVAPLALWIVGRSAIGIDTIIGE